MPATILDGKATAAPLRAELTERVVAAGVPGLSTGAIVEPGAAVLDVGGSRVDGKIAGDVAPDLLDVAGRVAPNRAAWDR